jgi:hypothetical protein
MSQWCLGPEGTTDCRALRRDPRQEGTERNLLGEELSRGESGVIRTDKSSWVQKTHDAFSALSLFFLCPTISPECVLFHIRNKQKDLSQTLMNKPGRSSFPPNQGREINIACPSPPRRGSPGEDWGGKRIWGDRKEGGRERPREKVVREKGGGRGGTGRGGVGQGVPLQSPLPVHRLSSPCPLPHCRAEGRPREEEVRQRESSSGTGEVRLSSPCRLWKKKKNPGISLFVRRPTSACSPGDNYKHTLGREGEGSFDRFSPVVILSSPARLASWKSQP